MLIILSTIPVSISTFAVIRDSGHTLESWYHVKTQSFFSGSDYYGLVIALYLDIADNMKLHSLKMSHVVLYVFLSFYSKLVPGKLVLVL